MKLFTRGAALSLFILIGFARYASAVPAPALTGNLPVYVQIGQIREIALSGKNLSAANSVVIAGEKDLDVTLIKPEKPVDNQARLKITAGSSAQPGDREIRVVSPGGVSNALTVAVGAYPLIEEVEPNNTRDEAQNIVLPAEIVGRIDGAGDVDQFKFAATRGQHLLFNAHIASLGSPLEPVLLIHDAVSGREFPTGAEQHNGDTLIVFDPPADGTYTVEVRDLRYRGGGDFNYRIEAGAIPFLEAVFPMSAPRGKVTQLQAIGHNLQGGETIIADLTAAPLGTTRVRAHTPLGFSNDVALNVTDASTEISAPGISLSNPPPQFPSPPASAAGSSSPARRIFSDFIFRRRSRSLLRLSPGRSPLHSTLCLPCGTLTAT